MNERAMDLLRVFDLQDVAEEPSTSLPYGNERRLEIGQPGIDAGLRRGGAPVGGLGLVEGLGHGRSRRRAPSPSTALPDSKTPRGAAPEELICVNYGLTGELENGADRWRDRGSRR